jgi:TRAP-type uncharacterized transport system substrate-binding protein
VGQMDDLKDLPQAIRETLREEISGWIRMLREVWMLLLLLFLLIAALLWLAKPAPPRSIAMAAGRPSDYSYHLAQQYVEFFAKNGVELRLIPTQGALENFDRLKDARDEIKISLIQAGLKDDAAASEGLLSLGSIAYEPIWLFYWGTEVDDLKKPLRDVLTGSISIGNIGSGTHVKALQLLHINGLSFNKETMLELPEDEAINALKSRRIQAMLLVENFASPLVQDLLKVDGLVVADFVRAKAYAKQLGYIEVLQVPMGSFSLDRNHPDHDTQLLSTTTTIIVDDDLHPAIQMLMMEASSAIVGNENFFGEAREFPSVKDSTITLSPIAQRYFEKGPPLLSYFVPFWLAEFIQRMGLLLLPFLAFAYPIVKSIPEFLQKRTRKKISRFYETLRRIEMEVRIDPSIAVLDSRVKALESMEMELLSLKINKALVPDFYALRSDIQFVREILCRLSEAQAAIQQDT